MSLDTDIEGDVGALDIDAMEQIREELSHLDGIVRTAGFDSLLDPTTLTVEFDDGIGGAGWCRFDIRWYRSGYYNIHYTDEREVNFRFDYHPKTGAPERHFHPPPDARSDDPEASCINVTEPRLVARAVHKLWRRAYDSDSFEDLNTARNPP